MSTPEQFGNKNNSKPFAQKAREKWHALSNPTWTRFEDVPELHGKLIRVEWYEQRLRETSMSLELAQQIEQILLPSIYPFGKTIHGLLQDNSLRWSTELHYSGPLNVTLHSDQILFRIGSLISSDAPRLDIHVDGRAPSERIDQVVRYIKRHAVGQDDARLLAASYPSRAGNSAYSFSGNLGEYVGISSLTGVKGPASPYGGIHPNHPI